MKKTEIINSILKLLGEETKRLKKKKNKSLVSTPVLRRPMGSIFSMDAAVSMSESINEGYGQKPVTRKFDHLKWKLNEFQKHFLDDFINIPEESIKEGDLVYASKRTGIPVESIKSIRNTYSEKKTPEQIAIETRKIQSELGIGGGMLDEKTIEDANKQFTDVRGLPSEKEGRFWSMNPNPHFRGETPGETIYKSKHGNSGGLHKKTERELPSFMYEWLLYFIEGSGKIKITESKLMNDFNSTKFDKYKYVLFSFDVSLKESKAHAYDLASTNAKLKELADFIEKLNEFNSTFGTNFIVGNQYTGKDGFLKVVLENAQITDGKKIYNREFIDMENTDIKKAISLGFYDEFTTSRSIT